MKTYLVITNKKNGLKKILNIDGYSWADVEKTYKAYVNFEIKFKRCNYNLGEQNARSN